MEIKMRIYGSVFLFFVLGVFSACSFDPAGIASVADGGASDVADMDAAIESDVPVSFDSTVHADAAADSDAAVDPDAAVASDSSVPLDAAILPDAAIEPDAYVEPDAAVLYYNDFSSQEDHFEENGNWTYDNESLCENSLNNPRWPRMRLYDGLLPQNDMIVETVMTVTGADLGHADWASAGVGVRSISTGAGNYYSYLCCLDLDSNRLVILLSNGAVVSELASTANDSVSSSSTFTLRASAQGTTIGCELLSEGSVPPLSVQSTTFTTGTAGFFTYRAAACWDYLLVY